LSFRTNEFLPAPDILWYLQIQTHTHSLSLCVCVCVCVDVGGNVLFYRYLRCIR